MTTFLETPALARLVEWIRAEADPDFDFASPGPLPWCAMAVPVSQARTALVTTAGLHLTGDEPFRSLEERLGDTSFRVIPHGAAPSDLALNAPYVDQRHIPRDPEVALPMRALEAVHQRGLAGPPSRRHASFTGGVVRPFPGLARSAEKLIAMLEEDGVQAVIFLPSCSLCVQTASLLARAVEAEGIPTVCLTLLPELSRIVGAPRTLALRFPYGAPGGDPGNAALHQSVLREALALLETATEPGILTTSDLAWRRTPAPLA